MYIHSPEIPKEFLFFFLLLVVDVERLFGLVLHGRVDGDVAAQDRRPRDVAFHLFGGFCKDGLNNYMYK